MVTLRRWLVLVLAAALVLVTASRLSGLWPCAEACSGGGYYRSLGGLDNLWPALACYLVLALLALRDVRSGASSGWTAAWAWLLAGVGVFYLSVALRLGMHCPFCFTVHGLAFAAALLLLPWPQAPALRAPPLLLLVGLLGANAAYHHAVVPDRVEVPAAAQPLASGEREALALMEAGRHRGRGDAQLLLDLVLDLQCPHCSAQYAGLLKALTPAVQEGRLRLCLRVLVRRSEPASRALARWAAAAALRSAGDHSRYLSAALGIKEGLTPEQVLSLREEFAPWAELARQRTAAVDALVDDDQRSIAALKLTGTTPYLVLSGPDGRERGRWQGDLDQADLLAALAKP